MQALCVVVPNYQNCNNKDLQNNAMMLFSILGALQCKICPAGTYQNSTGYQIYAPACELRRILFFETCLHTILLLGFFSGVVHLEQHYDRHKSTNLL